MSETYDIEYLKKHISGYQGGSILITGANGFFGSWMSRGLCNYNITLAGRENIDECLKGKYDYIFHFAPIPIEPIIDCAWKSDAKVLYASSGAVYGGARERVDEGYPVIPKTEYGMEKLRNEIVLKRSGLNYSIARLFTFCGTGMKNNFAITAFVDAVKNKKDINVFSDSVRTYMYIVDAVVWLSKIMLSENGVYNVGSEREITIGQLANQVSTFSIPKTNVVLNNKPFIDHAPYYVPECCKAKELGLHQHFTLAYGIERMMNER